MMQKYVTRKGIFYGTYYENYRGTRALLESLEDIFPLVGTALLARLEQLVERLAQLITPQDSSRYSSALQRR